MKRQDMKNKFKIILKAILYFIVSNAFMISMFILLKPLFFKFQKMDDYAALFGFCLIHGVIFIGMLIVIIIFSKYVGKESLTKIGIGLNKHSIIAYLKGIAIACVIGGLTCFINYLIYQPNIKFIDKSIPYFFIVLIAMFFGNTLQASYEELAFRSWGFHQLNKAISPIFTIIITSILFTLMHLINSGYDFIGFISLFVQGILFGYAYYKSKSTWMSIGLHGGWNFIISGFLLNHWFVEVTYNGQSINEFSGAEGTAIGILLPLLACIAVYFWTKREDERVLLTDN